MTYEELLDVKLSIEKLEHDMRGYNVDVHDYVTVEELVTAIQCIEKQIPEKPIEIHEIRSMDNEGNVTCEAIYYRCPICNKSVQINRGCSNNDCRQAIDWSDAE